MELLTRMNAKLDLGWKMTNQNCQKCNGVTLADPSNISEYYCPKCNKIYQFQGQFIKQEPQKYQNDYSDDQEKYFAQVLSQSKAFPKIPKSSDQNIINKLYNYGHQQFGQQDYSKVQQKTNDVSKKLGQKLIQGWTMLQQSCSTCNVPLMKSKKGQKICFGCNKDYAQIEKQQQSKKKRQKIESKKIQQTNINKTITKKQQIKREESPKQEISNSNSSRKQIIQRIEIKTLKFLQTRLDQLINLNDLNGVQKILQMIKKIQN